VARVTALFVDVGAAAAALWAHVGGGGHSSAMAERCRAIRRCPEHLRGPNKPRFTPAAVNHAAHPEELSDADRDARGSIEYLAILLSHRFLVMVEAHGLDRPVRTKRVPAARMMASARIHTP